MYFLRSCVSVFCMFHLRSDTCRWLNNNVYQIKIFQQLAHVASTSRIYYALCIMHNGVRLNLSSREPQYPRESVPT